jgi:hypothetical protein
MALRGNWPKASREAFLPSSGPEGYLSPTRESFLADVRYRLHQAQEGAEAPYDRLHRPVTYQVGEWVLPRLRQC